jgi:fumarylacetoacetate (FAA) hydrolase
MERRALEIVADGQARTPYLRFGDSIAIDCHDDAGRSIFGPMHNRIERA